MIKYFQFFSVASVVACCGWLAPVRLVGLHGGMQDSPATPANTAGRQQNTAVITASEVADWRLEGPVRTVAF